MLSSWGIEFEPVNIEGNKAALEELERLGVPLVPAVAVGERMVHGWQPEALAALLGVAYNSEPELDPVSLMQRLDRILAAAQRAILQMPESQLEMTIPERNRTVRNLAHHIFRLSLAFVDCLEQNWFPEAWLLEEPPPEMRTAAQIANYGAGVRSRLAAWFEMAPADVYKENAQTYYGEQSAHALLERTTWHAAQHLRQLYALLEMMNITPEHPLDAADFEGLPLPASLW